jgi:hypothetical protein
MATVYLPQRGSAGRGVTAALCGRMVASMASVGSGPSGNAVSNWEALFFLVAPLRDTLHVWPWREWTLHCPAGVILGQELGV